MGMLYITAPQQRACWRRWAPIKATIGVLVMALAWFGRGFAAANLGVLADPLLIMTAVLGLSIWLWGAGDFARSKGYSPWMGLLATPLPFGPLGFVLLFVLPDKWNPQRLDWDFEASPNTVDGVRHANAKVAREAMIASATNRLGTAGAFWVLVAIFEFKGRRSFSAMSVGTLEVISWSMIVIASILGVWGAANLARSKGYNPLAATIGFAFIPGAAWAASGSAYITALGFAFAAMWLGPLVVLLLPDAWKGMDRSPLRYNPNDLRELAPFQEVEDQVVWVN